ncbi:helix-turn-helix domain-containing protein [Mycobacterium sp. NPDC003323]
MSVPAASELPQTCYPAVWLWPGQALYSGPALGLDPHSGSVWCLAVGVQAPLTVDADGQRVTARTVLIPPRLTHQLRMQGPLVSCYLDPASQRSTACRGQFDTFVHGIGIGHTGEQQLITPPRDDAAARRWLDTAAPSQVHRVDPRIELAAEQIRDDPAAAPSAAELAADAGLSESRFLHLFTAEVGTSLRRYRLWCRLMRAGTELAGGANLTTAAVEAGFAGSSHLADRFKTTFGLSATQLLATGLTVRVP